MTSSDVAPAVSREAAIENAIMASPEAIGFPGALAIRRCRVAEPCGLVDLILLPIEGRTRLVLIEAKATAAQDASAKVVGQLLMYYAGALMLGTEGLAFLRRYAEQHSERSRSTTKISPKALTGGLSPGPTAWAAMYAGTRIAPDQIQLFIALDGEPHRAFVPTLRVLSEHHGLLIHYCVVRDGVVTPGAV